MELLRGSAGGILAHFSSHDGERERGRGGGGVEKERSLRACGKGKEEQGFFINDGACTVERQREGGRGIVSLDCGGFSFIHG